MTPLHTLMDGESCKKQYFLQDDVCRLCWMLGANRDLYSKSNKTNIEEKVELIDKIQNYLNIDLSLKITGNCPKKICEACFSKITDFYDFKYFCEESNRKLQEILGTGEEALPEETYVTSNTIKVENEIKILNLNHSDSLDSLLDGLQPNSAIPQPLLPSNIKKNPKRSKYKLKRCSTYCTVCCMDYKDIETLTIHKSESHGIESNGEFKCFGCEKKFKCRRARLGHETNFCKGLKQGYKCSICNGYLPKRRVYEMHMREHRSNTVVVLPDDLFKCVKCNMRFNTKENWKKHMKGHEKEKNYVCETCGRVFHRQDYLHKHALTHAGERRYACPHCDFRSTQKTTLNIHLRKHTGERPYSCDVCPQRCVSSSNLQAHRRRHLGLNSFQCHVCSKKFGYKMSLAEHIEATHEKSQSYPCPHCGVSYTRKRGLKRHLHAKHGIDNKNKNKNEKTDQEVSIRTDVKKQENCIRIPNEKIDGDFYVTEKVNSEKEKEMAGEFYLKIGDDSKYVCVNNIAKSPYEVFCS